MGGGTAADWTSRMIDRVDQLDADVTNFSSYVAGGTRHCIIGSNDLYSLETDDTKVVDWLAALIEGDQPDSVTCTDCENE